MSADGAIVLNNHLISPSIYSGRHLDGVHFAMNFLETSQKKLAGEERILCGINSSFDWFHVCSLCPLSGKYVLPFYQLWLVSCLRWLSVSAFLVREVWSSSCGRRRSGRHHHRRRGHGSRLHRHLNQTGQSLRCFLLSGTGPLAELVGMWSITCSVCGR